MGPISIFVEIVKINLLLGYTKVVQE